MTKHSAYTAKVADDAGYIDYTSEEDGVWRDLYAQQLPNIRALCAAEYLAGFDTLGLPDDRVPQCPDISARLRELTGWQVEPVPALIGFRQFFTMLANKTFPAASFIRSRADFDYIKEPDIFHEIFGHTPLLTDQRFASFSQAIGKAGMTAEAKDHAWLIRLYWFTIEFGLTRDGGAFKALGSGLASSPTELPHSVHGADVIRRDFDVMDILRTPYRIDIHQPIYFVLEDIDTLLQAAERDLIADVHAAQDLGLFAPAYPPKQKAG
ncbi:phenylalanine 4-monooxygenase [Litoreibacter albidus]|uniref:phenylalanine 4-monooxygenase n=1 Tax=Litoreibacter albidus TaxID=670155 RepID=UPI0037359164